MGHTFVRVRAAEHVSLLRLADVREVVAMMAIDELRERSGRCRGVVSLRGEVIPVFDATRADAPLRPDRFIVVAPFQDSHIGLLVDDVLEVITVSAEQVVHRPVGPARTAELVQLDGDLLPVMEPADVVAEPA